MGSNLDRVLAERIRAAAPVRAQVSVLTSDVTQRPSGQRALLDQAQQALEQRLRELTRGIPGVRLP